jgi:hypothetical protein
MKNLRQCSVAALTCAIVGTGTASALAETSADAPLAPTRSIWLAATYQVLLHSEFEPSSRHGVGASGVYEFHLSPRFNLGLSLAYRLYPGSQATQQLGYGATLKHFFGSRWATADGVHPFVSYGLLLQQSMIEGRKGSATSHDTRLAAGAVFRSSPLALFVDIGAHYSRLNYFDRSSTLIPYLEAQAGCVLAF